MAYSSGGLITASDYNNLVGTSTSTTSGQINAVWSIGNAQYGYGQTAIVQSAATAGLITATQWATLTNAINSVLAHQSGTGVGLTANTAGQTITAVSSVSTALTTIYTNHNAFATQGTIVPGATFSPNFTVAATTAAQTWTFTRTVTFSSGDAARYFFNAGGQLNFVTISATNGDATSRSADWVTLIATNLGNVPTIRTLTNGGRSGTGGTLNTNNTALGYFNASTAAATITQVTSTTSTYTGDYIICAIRTSAANVSGHGDNGAVVYLDFTVYSAAKSLSFNESINVTWNHRIDVVPPETTNLSNTWGTPTIT
jgi:hypothetical protein